MIYPLDKQIEFFLDTLYNPETGESERFETVEVYDEIMQP